MSHFCCLPAILAADVAGYSRLMGADEEGTLERLNALRRELVDPKIAEHHGPIVKTTGGGLLVEFPSVVDALRCAVEVQQAMAERNTSSSRDDRTELRRLPHREVAGTDAKYPSIRHWRDHLLATLTLPPDRRLLRPHPKFAAIL